MLKKRRRREHASRGTLGSLESLGLPEIVQSLTMARKTARVTLTCGERWGHIWIEDGKATHAKTLRAVGELAFYEMVGWQEGRFLIEPDVRSETRSLDHDPLYLVMEGSRRFDESRRPEPTGTPGAADELNPIPLNRSDPEPAETVATTSPTARAGPALRRSHPSVLRSPRRRVFLLSLLLAALVAVLFLPASALLRRVGQSAGIEPSAGPILPPTGSQEPAEPILRGPAFDTAGVEREPELVEARAEEPPTRRPPAQPEPESPKPKPVRIAPPEEGKASMAGPVAPDRAARLGTLGEPPEVGAGVETPPVVEDAFLRLSGESKVGGGTLTVLVDGREVYSRELAEIGIKKRMFSKGEMFETLIPLPAGEYEIAALLSADETASDHEDRLVLSLETGTTREVRLVTSRKRGRELVLSEGDTTWVAATELD